MDFKPGIRQRGNSYHFTLSLCFDGNGNHIRKYKTYTPPKGLTEKQLKKNVEAAYDEFKSKTDGNKSQKDSMKLSQLSELYFAEYTPNRLKEVTAYAYNSSYQKNIKPALGNIRLQEIITLSLKSRNYYGFGIIFFSFVANRLFFHPIFHRINTYIRA